MITNSTPGRTRVLAFVVLVATFLAGGAAGIAADRFVRPTPAAAEAGGEEREKDADKRHRRGHVLDQLSLTAEQQARIDGILERRRGELEAFWDEAGPELRAIADSARADIRAVLTADQRERYDRLLAERRAEKRKRWKDDDDGN